MQAGLTSLIAHSGTAESSKYSATDIQQTDDAFAALFDDQEKTPQEMLKDLTSGGITGFMKWKIEQMREKATAQVMNSMGVTKAQVEAMGTDQRIAIEKKIETQVEQQIKMAIQQEMKRNNTGNGLAAFDPMTTSAMLAGQEV